MKAFVFEKYGQAEVLELREIQRPSPAGNEVLVRIHAVSINDWDWGLLTGTPFVNRLQNGLFKPAKYKIAGSDIAGIVEKTGSSVSRFKVGDAVFGDLSGRWGGFAEYVCASEDMLAIKPSSMSFEQAAAIPQAGMLAVQGLLDKTDIQSVKKLLINGAGGGVGTFAVQIARMYNIEVTGVDNSEKQEMMLSCGFDNVIDYTKEDFTQRGLYYDLILDQKSNRSIFACLKILSPRGSYVITGGEIKRLLQAFLLSPFIALLSKKRVRIVILKPNKDLAYMSEQFEKGSIKPLLDNPYPMQQLPQAMACFGEGRHKGKVIVKFI